MSRGTTAHKCRCACSREERASAMLFIECSGEAHDSKRRPFKDCHRGCHRQAATGFGHPHSDMPWARGRTPVCVCTCCITSNGRCSFPWEHNMYSLGEMPTAFLMHTGGHVARIEYFPHTRPYSSLFVYEPIPPCIPFAFTAAAAMMTARTSKISLQTRFAGTRLQTKTRAARPAPILVAPQAAFFSKTKATAAAPRLNVRSRSCHALTSMVRFVSFTEPYCRLSGGPPVHVHLSWRR